MDPEEPTFSGFLIMNSLYKSLEQGRLFGVKVGFRVQDLGFAVQMCLHFCK